MILPTIDEYYEAKVFPRKKNGFEWESKPSVVFKCRPANNLERKEYRIQKGVIGGEESIYIYASNLPKELKVNDRIEFLGDIKTVKSIGYYFENNLIVNAGLYSRQRIINNSPKGITLQ